MTGSFIFVISPSAALANSAFKAMKHTITPSLWNLLEIELLPESAQVFLISTSDNDF